jgi:hypothetical protein
MMVNAEPGPLPERAFYMAGAIADAFGIWKNLQ